MYGDFGPEVPALHVKTLFLSTPPTPNPPFLTYKARPYVCASGTTLGSAPQSVTLCVWLLLARLPCVVISQDLPLTCFAKSSVMGISTVDVDTRTC